MSENGFSKALQVACEVVMDELPLGCVVTKRAAKSKREQTLAKALTQLKKLNGAPPDAIEIVRRAVEASPVNPGVKRSKTLLILMASVLTHHQLVSGYVRQQKRWWLTERRIAASVHFMCDKLGVYRDEAYRMLSND